MVAPDKNTVVVFTSSLSRKNSTIPLGMLASYIIPAVKSPISLSENHTGTKVLNSKINRWRDTTTADREKINKNAEKYSQELKYKEYVNFEFGFTVKYDGELPIIDDQLESPLVYRRKGLSGFPEFAVLVDDIPQGMALEYTADYMIDLYKMAHPTTYHKINREELIKLSDGTDANYVEINWIFQSRGMLTTVGLFAYKNYKIIGVVAGSIKETPIEYLVGIVKSLRFTK